VDLVFVDDSWTWDSDREGLGYEVDRGPLDVTNRIRFANDEQVATW